MRAFRRFEQIMYGTAVGVTVLYATAFVANAVTRLA